jgi:hypothetical protein
MAVYKRLKQNPRIKANVANQCHIIFTSKNKCLSDQVHSPYDCPLSAIPNARGMAAA